MLRWMTNLRNLIARILRHPPDKPPSDYSELTPERVDYAYTIFWTKQVRTWDDGQRKAVRAAVAAVIHSPDFTASTFERKYQVGPLGSDEYSGASLLTLEKVLAAFAED